MENGGPNSPVPLVVPPLVPGNWKQKPLLTLLYSAIKQFLFPGKLMTYFKVDNKWNLAENEEVVMDYVIYSAAWLPA